MKPIIHWTECLKDSPKFRFAVQETEDNVDQLESKLEKVVKLSQAMVEAGKGLIKAKSAFINGVHELTANFSEDESMTKPLQRVTQTLSDFVKFESMLIDQTNRAVSRNLSLFVKTDVAKVKETKKHFDKISDELDSILVRSSQVTRSKAYDWEETNNLLTATRSLFQHTSIDYVTQLSCLQSKKRHEVLDSLMSLMQAYGTYFHQGEDAFQDFEPFVKQTGHKLVAMRSESVGLEKQLERNHCRVTAGDTVPTLLKGDHVKLEGYLFKRTSNAFKTWNRRWFIIQDNQLVYQKRSFDSDLTVMEEDLRLCSVKPAPELERRYCFEIVSPFKSHILQADSEEACKQWITAMEAGIDAAYNDNSKRDQVEGSSTDSLDSSTTSSTNSTSKSSQLSPLANSASNPVKPIRAYSQILAVPGNEQCGDCRAPNPKWASINLTITLCIECSGIHRSLGVHVSKVRSLMLDAWEPEWVQVMLSLGNTLVNEVYEAHVDPTVAERAVHDSSRNVRETWIKSKYLRRSFVSRSDGTFGVTGVSGPGSKTESAGHLENQPDLEKVQEEQVPDSQGQVEGQEPQVTCSPIVSLPPDTNLYNEMLYKATAISDIKGMNEALAKGALINSVNDSDEGKSPIHEAVCSGSVDCCEYLLLNGAKINAQDNFGRTPLLLATESVNTGLVCLLLKRGAEHNHCDKQGRDALNIAVEKANADIVTLLRLAKLNEEMKDDELGNASEEIFNEVVRDFSHLASTKKATKANP